MKYQFFALHVVCVVYMFWVHIHFTEKNEKPKLHGMLTQSGVSRKVTNPRIRPLADAEDAPEVHWLVLFNKRVWAQEITLQSLHDAGVRKNILISADGLDSERQREVISKFNTLEARVIHHPFACSRHPTTFPGNDPRLNIGYRGDLYKNNRSEWATCLKHHWWWAMHIAWRDLRDMSLLCFLEEDTPIHPQTLDWIRHTSRDHIEDDTFGLKLHSTASSGIPMCMTSKTWERVSSDAAKFCEHDDYNWDKTLAWLMPDAIVRLPPSPLTRHIGTCEGFTPGRTSKCTQSQIRQEARGFKLWSRDRIVHTRWTPGRWLNAHARPNGGWAHPMDVAHCKELTFPKLDILMDSIPQVTTSRALIQTENMFQQLKYVDRPNGAWTQGWRYEYDGRFDTGAPLQVHVVLHSHNDPGWLRTYQDYFSGSTAHILNSVVIYLTEHPDLTFMWSEISLLSSWWTAASPPNRTRLRRLVARGQFDIVTGGWVMNDEASPTARGIYAQMEQGLVWVNETFGIRPKYSWQNDPFGHSMGHATILKRLGFKGIVIQRVHYEVKRMLATKQNMEFSWRTPAGDILTHMMPFYSYDVPHTCGPDPRVCCQFDFARSTCPWGKHPIHVNDSNVKERASLWFDQIAKKAMLSDTKSVLIPIGDDFRLTSVHEIQTQHSSYARMFRWLNENRNVRVRFSTISNYFRDIEASISDNVFVPAVMVGSFFPYADRHTDYWTGYFNSRISYKVEGRVLEKRLFGAQQVCPRAHTSLTPEMRALSLFLHHDTITGTSRTDVMQDSSRRVQAALTNVSAKLSSCLHLVEYDKTITTFNPTGFYRDEYMPWEMKTTRKDVQNHCKPIDEIEYHTTQDGVFISSSVIDKTYIHESVLLFQQKIPQESSDQSGAYLMTLRDGEVVRPVKTVRCSLKHGQYQTITSFTHGVRRTVTWSDSASPHFQYSLDMRDVGELFVRYRLLDESNEPLMKESWLCADMNDVLHECHMRRSGIAPLWSQFYPVTTMAWMEDETHRLTALSDQPTGVALLEDGLYLHLDRITRHDDSRGLRQPLNDSRPVNLTFALVIERSMHTLGGEITRPDASTTLTQTTTQYPFFLGYPSLQANFESTLLQYPVVSLARKTYSGGLRNRPLLLRRQEWAPENAYLSSSKAVSRHIDTQWNSRATCVIPVVNRNPDYLAKNIRGIASICNVRVYDANAEGAEYEHLHTVCSTKNVLCFRVPMSLDDIVTAQYSLGDRIQQSLTSSASADISYPYRNMIDPNDSRYYKVWRTREGWTMAYALRHTLSSLRAIPHIIWLQDDVQVRSEMNWTSIDSDLTCLRVGRSYCGATAFAFSRRFASKLISFVESYMHIAPVDWIIEWCAASLDIEYLKIPRIPLAFHIGSNSSNGRHRYIDA